MGDTTYVVTDIETDGPWPGPNAMRSFASVAVRADGTVVDEFEAVLEPLPGSSPNPDTLAWFRTIPEVWAAATEGARPPAEVMAAYVDWVRQLPGDACFAACPLAFDGLWIDLYLRRYTPYGLTMGPYEADQLFPVRSLCLASYGAAVTGQQLATFRPTQLPAEWLGDVEHTHRAIDDARGYAHLLGELHRRAGAL